MTTRVSRPNNEFPTREYFRCRIELGKEMPIPELSFVSLRQAGTFSILGTLSMKIKLKKWHSVTPESLELNDRGQTV